MKINQNNAGLKAEKIAATFFNETRTYPNRAKLPLPIWRN